MAQNEQRLQALNVVQLGAQLLEGPVSDLVSEQRLLQAATTIAGAPTAADIDAGVVKKLTSAREDLHRATAARPFVSISLVHAVQSFNLTILPLFCTHRR
jgi:histidine ammonia-lyase